MYELEGFRIRMYRFGTLYGIEQYIPNKREMYLGFEIEGFRNIN